MQLETYFVIRSTDNYETLSTLPRAVRTSLFLFVFVILCRVRIYPAKVLRLH